MKQCWCIVYGTIQNKFQKFFYGNKINFHHISMTSYWARWRLKSPASRLFTQPFIQAQIKESIKAPRHWPLWGEFTGDRSIPRTKASNAENVSIWWCHHENCIYKSRLPNVCLSGQASMYLLTDTFCVFTKYPNPRLGDYRDTNVKASQITGNLAVCSATCPDLHQRNFNASHHWPSEWGIRQWQVDLPHKRCVTPSLLGLKLLIHAGLKLIHVSKRGPSSPFY